MAGQVISVRTDYDRVITNVVSGKTLRKIQNTTLKTLREYLSKTFGPMGSYTKIIKGNNKDTISSAYSKDGLRVLQNISSDGPIEMSIIEELVEVTRHVEKEVGDGTTSTVILSSLIFEQLMKIQEETKLPPFQLIRKFETIVSLIKDVIKSNANECTLDDIYDISMISTNGNTEVAQNIRDIYEKYGMDVDLSVGISNDYNSVVKEYDGLTITEGMSDPVYITNKEKGTAEIHNARIYHFKDPIDDLNMINLFEAIINHNIYEAYQNNEAPVPTVITCPRISRDLSTLLRALANQLYQFDQKNAQASKPPILIITNVVASDEVIMDDIANICGCKTIHKYIDPNIMKRDQENGSAPTVNNVWEFCGQAELVVSDSNKTKFINPKHMHIYTEDGQVLNDPIYTSMINFLETEIANSSSTDTANEIGLLKKRLSALKANSVDYLVGGVTVSERDAMKDLVEDAIKNCRSAARNGVGYAANVEGAVAAHHIYKMTQDEEGPKYFDKVDCLISKCIWDSYQNIIWTLYETVSSDADQISICTKKTIEDHIPYNISSGTIPEEPDGRVKCSIMLDIHILDTISKIITMMVTSNQCLLQAPQLNTYR